MKLRKYPAEHSALVFICLALVGGFLEAYTFLLHGGVFCNAQTGNIVLLTLNLFSGNFSKATRYIYSITAYIIGILMSAILKNYLSGKKPFIAVSAFEILSLVAIAFIPVGADDWYTYVSVAFLCALQYNTFTMCCNSPLATTFCTNNLRQTVLRLYGGLRTKDKAMLKTSGVYATIVVFFASGALLGALASENFNNFSTLICAAVLLIPFIYLIYDELHSEKSNDQPNNTEK